MWLRAIAPIYSTYSVHDQFSGNKEKELRRRRPYLYENVMSLVFRKQSFLKLCIYQFSFFTGNFSLRCHKEKDAVSYSEMSK